MYKKTLGFIESNTTGTGFLFLKKALKLGFEVLFLTQNPSKYPFLSELNITVLSVDTQDKNALLEILKQYPGLIGVFSSSEYYIEMTAFLAGVLKLPGNQVQTVTECRNKKLFYEKLAKSPFSIPQTWSVENLEEIVQKQSEFVFPVIVKPVAGTGSIGVKRCATFSELYEHASQLLLQKTNERGLKTATGVLIQEYVKGPEYSAEVIVNQESSYLFGITAKHTTDNNYFIETGHDFPAILEEKLQEHIWNSLKDILRFLNFSFGPAHIEFKLQGSKIIIIEVNPRLAGGMIPQLICHACGIDVYEIILNLYANEKVHFPSLSYEGASIRFFVAQKNGKITNLGLGTLKQCKDVVEIHFTKKIGEYIEIYHDYRDRIGYVITKSPHTLVSRESADQALKHVYVEIEEAELNGRLHGEPHPLIKQILRKPINKEKWKDELIRITYIDIAHLLMLSKNDLIPLEQVRLILKTIKDFQSNLDDCFEQLDFSRGTYYAYEYYLKSKLGLDLSGNNHMARSRNDINATLLHLLCRHSFRKIFQKLLTLSEILLKQAQKNEGIPLPIYSQHQPAAPGSYGFYLLAMNEPIRRILDDLTYVEKYLNTSPLGAGTGCGTDIPIDSLYVGNLLGFDSVFNNALDAIANRDFVLRYKSILANLCTTLSRIAQDYQLWTTQEFHFFELPDNLCGSSSMMPQKKNPYILEVIKSKTTDIISNLMGTFAKMHKVPTGNSMEVSSAAYDTIDNVTAECIDSIDLLILIITHAKSLPENMLKANRKGLTIATFLANQMMKKQSISFREAHLKIGDIIRSAQENLEDPYQKLTEDDGNFIDEEKLLNSIIQALNYGGGPSSISIANQMAISLQSWQKSYYWIIQKEKQWEEARQYLENEAEKLSSSSTCICQS